MGFHWNCALGKSVKSERRFLSSNLADIFPIKKLCSEVSVKAFAIFLEQFFPT